MGSNFQFSNLCGSVYSRGAPPQPARSPAARATPSLRPRFHTPLRLPSHPPLMLAAAAAGNVAFTPCGNKLVSPVGNRVTVFDLASSTSVTLPFEHVKDIKVLCLSPDGVILVTVDVDGRCLVSNLAQRIVLHHFNFKAIVRDLQYSPCGNYIACAVGNRMQVWNAPGRRREFAPFILHRSYAAHHDDIRAVSWSEDSRYIGTASKDMTARIFSLHPEEGFTPVTLAAHRDEVVAMYFVHAEDGYRIYTVGRDAGLFTWLFEPDEVDEDEDEEAAAERLAMTEARPAPAKRTVSFAAQAGKWKLADRHYFQQNHARVVSCSIARSASKADGENETSGVILAVGFTNGVFSLNQLVPTFQEIHSLSISQNTITTACLNPTGEWVAFGSSKLGQLLVWEWRSETYVLKQQGHYYDVCALAYSPDGTLVVTGGDDGKVKVWQTATGFCTVTFTEHTGPVKAVTFAKGGNVVISASVDGTCRAFDLLRYRNFRTFTTPDPAAFASLAVDSAGEVVAAGSADSFEIYVWAMQTGKLLDVLAGHEGPISCLAFSPSTSVSTRTLLASGSWDSSVRVWDIFSGRKGAVEAFENSYDVLSLAFRPDGKELCACALDGALRFWTMEGEHTSTIEGRYDIRGGRGARDVRTAETNAATHHFTTLAYTADGQSVLAGGNSRWVCLYDCHSKVLLHRFEICRNTSLDGVKDQLNSKNVGEGGAKDLIEDDDGDSDMENEYDRSKRDKFDTVAVAGGAKDDGRRKTARRIKTHGVRFCPTGHGWCAATTEGLILYRSDRGGELMFDPSDLSLQLTRESVLALIHGKPGSSEPVEPNHALALMGALRLGESDLTREAYLAVPLDQIGLVATSLPSAFVPKLMECMVQEVENSRHVEYNMRWLLVFLNQHGDDLRRLSTTPEIAPRLRALLRVINSRQAAIGSIADENMYTLRFLSNSKVSALLPDEDEDSDDQEDNDEVEDDDDNDADDDGDEEEDEAEQRASARAMPGWDEGGSDDGSDDEEEEEDEEEVVPPKKSRRGKGRPAKRAKVQ